MYKSYRILLNKEKKTQKKTKNKKRFFLKKKILFLLNLSGVPHFPEIFNLISLISSPNTAKHELIRLIRSQN